MQQNSRDRDALDQLRDRSKPIVPNNFREQTRPRGMLLQDVSAKICRGLGNETRIFGVVMQKNQACRYEQCCATSVFVLHLRWGRRFYSRAPATPFESAALAWAERNSRTWFNSSREPPAFDVCAANFV